MFCSKLKNIDLSSFDTKNVNNMSSMFIHCSNLTNMDLSSFDTKMLLICLICLLIVLILIE